MFFPRTSGRRLPRYVFREHRYALVYIYLVGQDIRYLKPHVENVEKEELERRAWDNMVVSKK